MKTSVVKILSANEPLQEMQFPGLSFSIAYSYTLPGSVLKKPRLEKWLDG